MDDEPTAGTAFVKGGLGCLLIQVPIVLCALMMGGRIVRINISGIFCTFVIGGILGLIVLMIYNKGRNNPR